MGNYETDDCAVRPRGGGHFFAAAAAVRAGARCGGRGGRAGVSRGNAFGRGGGTLPLRSLYAESRSRSELVATFLSVLELCSVGDVHLTLEGDDVLLSFAGGSVEGALEKIEEM